MEPAVTSPELEVLVPHLLYEGLSCGVADDPCDTHSRYDPSSQSEERFQGITPTTKRTSNISEHALHGSPEEPPDDEKASRGTTSVAVSPEVVSLGKLVSDGDIVGSAEFGADSPDFGADSPAADADYVSGLAEMFPDNGCVPAEILDGLLFVGPSNALSNGEWLLSAGIGTIIDLRGRSRLSNSQLRNALSAEGIQHLRGANIYFDEHDSLEFSSRVHRIIEAAPLERNGNGILCVDKHGCAQAATVAIALLMYSMDFSFDDALTRVSDAVEEVQGTPFDLCKSLDFAMQQYLQGDFSTNCEKHFAALRDAAQQERTSIGERAVNALLNNVQAFDGDYWRMASPLGRRRSLASEALQTAQEPGSSAPPTKKSRISLGESGDMASTPGKSAIETPFPLFSSRTLRSWVAFETFARPFVDAGDLSGFSSAIDKFLKDRIVTEDDAVVCRHVFFAVCSTDQTAHALLNARFPGWSGDTEYLLLPETQQFTINALLAGCSDAVRHAAGVPSRRRRTSTVFLPTPSVLVPKSSAKVALPLKQENVENAEVDLDGDYWKSDGSSRVRRARLLGAAGFSKAIETLDALQQHAAKLMEQAVAGHIGNRDEVAALSPNSYFYKFCMPNEPIQTGPWSAREHSNFMAELRETPLVAVGRSNPAKLEIESSSSLRDGWGLFSIRIAGRQGSQCFRYFKHLIVSGVILDPAFRVVDGKAHLVPAKKDAGAPAAAKVTATKNRDRIKQKRSVEAAKDREEVRQTTQALKALRVEEQRAEAQAEKMRERRAWREAQQQAETRRREERQAFLLAQAIEQEVGHEVCAHGDCRLFLGGKRAAANLEWMLEANVKMVVNVTTDTKNYLSGDAAEHIEFVRFALKDSTHQAMIAHDSFIPTLDRIHAHLSSRKGSLLVHCAEGRSRSVAMCMCYLMRFRDFSLRTAMEHLESIREFTEPNLNHGFQQQLMDFERILHLESGCNSAFTPSLNFFDLRSRRADSNAGRPRAILSMSSASLRSDLAVGDDSHAALEEVAEESIDTKFIDQSGPYATEEMKEGVLSGCGAVAGKSADEYSAELSDYPPALGEQSRATDAVLCGEQHDSPVEIIDADVTDAVGRQDGVDADVADADCIDVDLTGAAGQQDCVGAGSMAAAGRQDCIVLLDCDDDAPPPPTSRGGSRFYLCKQCSQDVSVFDKLFHDSFRCRVEARKNLVQSTLTGSRVEQGNEQANGSEQVQRRHQGDWARALSNGSLYYYNLITRETSWMLPTDAVLRDPSSPPAVSGSYTQNKNPKASFSDEDLSGDGFVDVVS